MILIFDSYSGEKKPLNKEPGEELKIYVCGPTVYDHPHLGHGRSAVAFDLARRFLTFAGYKVSYVSNYTDIDDKMIDRAEKEGISVAELAEKIIPEYEKDYALLGIEKPDYSPRATEQKYIDEMIALIKNLEEKGHAYALSDGIYFDISTFADYGKLSHQKLDELMAGSRVEERSDKKNHQDFVLWKLKKEGEPFWASPWGEGRPGWHIECSAMSKVLLGETFDIHGGGLDLKFPHHEGEIAQSTAASGKPLAHFWMHNGFVTVDKEKMSKSLGNFFTLKDVFKKFHPRVVRFFLISTHYRSPIEFSDELLEQAKNTLKTLDEFYLKNRDGTNEKKNEVDEELLKKFAERMNNDFDTAGAFAEIFEWIKTNPSKVQGTLERINLVLQIFPTDFSLTAEQEKLITEREEARNTKDWAKSDQIRDKLTEQGIEIEDSPQGSFAKPKL